VRSRATTLQEGIAPILSSPRNTQESERENAQQGDDVFEHRAEDGAEAIAAVEAADTFSRRIRRITDRNTELDGKV